jgi:predicted nucleic-acid-binding protein
MLCKNINFKCQESLALDEWLIKYKNDNERFQKMKLDKQIVLKKNIDLKFYDCKEYTVSHVYRERVANEIKRLEKEDVIELCSSSPAFIIEKKNKEIRLVVDYRHINNYLSDEIIQIPKIHDSLRFLGGRSCYSQIDLKNGFNQLELDK